MTQVIKVCVGCACAKNFGEDNLKRAEKILGIKAGETTPDGRFKLEKSGCLGHCSEAPNVLFCSESAMGSIINDGEFHNKMLPHRFEKLLHNKRDNAL